MHDMNFDKFVKDRVGRIPRETVSSANAEAEIPSEAYVFPDCLKKGTLPSEITNTSYTSCSNNK
jgi:hypothetical protein